jgi:hypothetical protein
MRDAATFDLSRRSRRLLLASCMIIQLRRLVDGSSYLAEVRGIGNDPVTYDVMSYKE